jgi:SAM-dependent methyltransferase
MKKIISWLIRYIPRKYLQRISGTGMKIVGFFYSGDSVQCTVCGRTYRKFLPYGRINPRENALCPHCLSLERHRLIWYYLKEHTSFFSTKLDVLHIAPEACFIERFEKVHGDHYITADIESPLAKVKMDIHQIPFEEHTFDVVLCNHVLEHVENDIKAVSEIHRVLKPGGFAILQVPFFPPLPTETFENPTITDKREREKVFGQDDHVRKYGLDYSKRLERGGLEVEEIDLFNTLSEEEVNRFGFMKGEVIYKGVKK